MSSTYLPIHKLSHILWLKNSYTCNKVQRCWIRASVGIKALAQVSADIAPRQSRSCHITGVNKSYTENLTFSVTFSTPVFSSCTILLICLALLRLSSGSSWWC